MLLSVPIKGGSPRYLSFGGVVLRFRDSLISLMVLLDVILLKCMEDLSKLIFWPDKEVRHLTRK